MNKNGMGHIDRSHARFSPSASARWMTCHGSVRANDGDSSPSSDAAIWGTECHEAAGAVLDQGALISDACAHLTDEQEEMVRTYVDFTIDIINDVVLDTGKNPVTWIETFFESTTNPDYAGTADFAMYDGNGFLTVVDLKTGFVPVRVRDLRGEINSQLGSYAALVWENLPNHIRGRVKTIDLWIVQPRVHAEPIKVTIDITELYRFRDRVYGDIGEILDGDESRHAGEHCKYCAVKGNCKTQRDFVAAQAVRDFDIGPVAMAEQRFSDTELAAATRHLETIELYVAALREQVQRRLEHGAEIDGWKLVARRAVDKWSVDPDHVVWRLQNELGPDVLYRRTLRTPGQIEKALDAAGSWIDISDLHEKKSAGNSIARTEDRRKAVVVKPGDEFDDQQS